MSAEREAQANCEISAKDSNDLVNELAESVIEKTKSIARFKTEAEDVKSDHISTGKRLDLAVEEFCWRYMMRRGPDGVPIGMVNPCWRAQRVAVSSGSYNGCGCTKCTWINWA